MLAGVFDGLLNPPRGRVLLPRKGGRPPKYRPGDQVGEWTLLEFRPGHAGPNRKAAQWLCRCSCGCERLVRSCNLAAGQTTSCGHARKVVGEPIC